jgi:protein involved in polysaccharide export with SLBB domain
MFFKRDYFVRRLRFFTEKIIMFNEKIKFLSFIYVVLFFFISACSTTLEAPGIRVKEFKESSRITTVDLQAQQQNEAEEIVRLSQVKENSAFTERNGVPEYIIGPGDVLTINLWLPYSISTADRSRFFEEGYKQNTYTVLVRQDGKISYIFGDDVPVSGLTVNELRQVLTNQLKTYIRNPRIELFVKEYKSKNALLFGQINILQQGISGPGKYPLMGKTTVLDLIVTAGGAISGRDTANADLRNVEIVRKGKRYTINLYNAMFRGDITQNIIIDDGDIVTVPELPTFGERVFVFGEVNRQGIYRLKDADDLLAAIGNAGSTTLVAVKSDIKIIRDYRERPGKPIILSANLDEILKRGDLAQNVKLRDGDVVYVPRQVIGDINEFIVNTVPLLEYLMKYPRGYTDAYFLNPANKLRF